MDPDQWLESSAVLVVFGFGWFLYRGTESFRRKERLQAGLSPGSWRLLASEPIALVYCAAMVIVTLTALGLMIYAADHPGHIDGRQAGRALFGSIILFTPLASCGAVAVTLKRLRGETPSFSDGIRGIVDIGSTLIFWSWRSLSMSPDDKDELGDAANFMIPILLNERKTFPAAIERSKELYASAEDVRDVLEAAGDKTVAVVASVALAGVSSVIAVVVACDGRWSVLSLVVPATAVVGCVAAVCAALYVVSTTAVYLSVAGSPKEQDRVSALFPILAPRTASSRRGAS